MDPIRAVAPPRQGSRHGAPCRRGRRVVRGGDIADTLTPIPKSAFRADGFLGGEACIGAHSVPLRRSQTQRYIQKDTVSTSRDAMRYPFVLRYLWVKSSTVKLGFQTAVEQGRKRGARLGFFVKYAVDGLADGKLHTVFAG